MNRENIDFPKYCLFFIKKISEAIKGVDFSEPYRFEIDSEYPYCSEAFELIIKTFEKKGYYVNTPSFKIHLVDGSKRYLYRWRFQKGIDDLPFQENKDLCFDGGHAEKP